MTETDARMSFERHATSKIKLAEDLFKIKTKGFRGEALASIAAIAQVELKTKTEEREVGTCICIEGTEVISQEPCSTPTGTSIAVKNLFFNVPARRNFLKSNHVEFSHISEEFLRIAIAHPDIAFSLYHNNQDVFILEKSTLRQRIVNIYGNNFNEKLVPVGEETTILNLSGFIGKPEFAKKTRGEQYFFINNRYIKNNYLHHAVLNAYEQLLSKDSFPSYFLFMEMDPALIDVNIHPTKTEVKFEDERSIYAILRSAIKMALGKNNIAPTLDFDQEATLAFMPPPSGEVRQPTIKVDPTYNPFKTESFKTETYKSPLQQNNERNWQKLYSGFEKQEEAFENENKKGQQELIEPAKEISLNQAPSLLYQLHNKYILASIKSGLVIIDQHRAHERILYEKFSNHQGAGSASQQLLFPLTVEFSTTDATLLNELHDELLSLGIDLSPFGKSTFVIQGIPAGTQVESMKDFLESFLESYRWNSSGNKLSKTENLARSMARNLAVRAGKILSGEEMRTIIDELFACSMPYATPAGKTIIITLNAEELEKRFN
jgi:DNA mismatch repair protein MutL